MPPLPPRDVSSNSLHTPVTPSHQSHIYQEPSEFPQMRSPPDLTMSGSRLRGPRELPEYDSNTHNYDPLGYETLPDRTPPYPISDPLQNLSEETITPIRSAKILDQSLVTPTKIPSLETPNPLNYEDDYFRQFSPSPDRHLAYSERSRPEDPYLKTTINSPSRSPSPNKIYGRSPSLMYDRFRYRNDDDRSPERSPDRSPESSPERSPFDSTYDHPMYNLGPFLTALPSRNYGNPGSSGPIGPSGLTGPIRPEIVLPYDNQYEYDDEYISDESPTSHLFDYSILPDLPSVSTVKEDASELSPTKRMTLNSAISFVQDKSYFGDSPKIGTRKKNDELPPVPLDLPKLPFTSSSLVSRHFSICSNVWSLKEIFNWCLKLRIWLHDQFILKKEFKKALIKLLVFHKRDVPLDTIGPNVDQILQSLIKCKAISYDFGTLPNDDGEKALPTLDAVKDDHRPTRTDPGVVFHEESEVSGVLVDLTNCYSYKRDHQNDDLKAGGLKLRCLSSRCSLNRVIDYEIKFRNTDISEIVLGDDWASHWKLTADDLKKFDKDVSKKQSLIFDLLRYEQTFIQRAKCFVEVVGPEFVKAVRSFIGSLEIILVNNFNDDVINPGSELLQIHRKSLFEPLLKILISNGKFIKDLNDIGDIYYNWSQVVKSALLKYMGTVPMIEELLHIPIIKQWVDINVRNMSKVKELKVNGPLLFMSTFNSRYQLLPLQLQDIMKEFDEQDSEYGALSKALNGIKKTGTKVNEMKYHADNIHSLKRIQKQLVWKNNVPKPNLNFSSENRKFLFRGDLTRKGDLKINSSLCHVILLDNYLLITERLKNNKSPFPQYRVIEAPIPIEFLLVEVREKEAPTIELNSIAKTLTSLPQQPSPKHEFTADGEDPSIYPFKVRYAGHGKGNAFVFSTRNERERTSWVTNLMKARTNLCNRLAKVEPYKLKLVSNTCFAYEESHRIYKLQSVAENDPIEKMATNSLDKLSKLGYKDDLYNLRGLSSLVALSSVQSAECCTYNNTNFYFVGTGIGVYCSDMMHEWKKVILINDTTKISILPQMNIAIMLSGNTLRYFPLDVLTSYYYSKRDTISSVILSNEAVSFFEIAKHRGITMLFYARKKSNSSGATNFKVCVPETDNDGIISAFKVVKKFYVQAECFGISIFNSTFAVHTSKGIEILELDKLIPRSVPELPNGETSSKRIDGYARRSMGLISSNNSVSSTSDLEQIRKLIYSTSSKPLGMFKLNNNSEFLLVYNGCAIFINKHGKLSRTLMLRFDYKAKSIAFSDNNLFLVCEEVIEVWSISDFVKGTNRLIQVIVGKDIHIVNSQSLICSMANPIIGGLQLLFQLKPRNM